MKRRPIEQLVYEYMFPKAKANDPQSFQTLLHRHLVLEVRQEVHSFYGHLDTQEAKYPGLDYCHPIHRIRLSRWPWHRRLFRAFDGLRLTDSEISHLTKWEGTKWAKERFERDSGIVIEDTAHEDIGVWIEPEDRHRQEVPEVEIEENDGETLDNDMTTEEYEGVQDVQEVQEEEDNDDDDDDDDEEEEDDSDDEMESIGVALNERLRERAARREAGDVDAGGLEEDWEQWLKNAIESGELPFESEQLVRHSNEPALIPQALFPPQMLSAARAGLWTDIPDFLHELLRQTIAREAASSISATPSPSSHADASPRGHMAAQWRRTYSDLRLPAGEGSTGTAPERLNRTAQSGA